MSEFFEDWLKERQYKDRGSALMDRLPDYEKEIGLVQKEAFEAGKEATTKTVNIKDKTAGENTGYRLTTKCRKSGTSVIMTLPKSLLVNLNMMDKDGY